MTDRRPALNGRQRTVAVYLAINLILLAAVVAFAVR